MAIFWILIGIILGYAHYQIVKSGVDEETKGITFPIYVGFAMPVIMFVGYFFWNWFSIMFVTPFALIALIGYLIWELTQLKKNKLSASITLILFYLICWCAGIVAWDMTGISLYHG